MWMEETLGTRINQMRTQEAIDAKADLIFTACPFCLTMLEDGLKELGREEEIQVKDIAEAVSEGLKDA